MKKIVSILITICIIISALSTGLVVSFAAGTKIDGTDVTWSYDSDTKVLTFGGVGAIPDYNEYKTSSGDVSLKYPWKNLAYTSIVFGNKITGIGNYAFCYSKALKEVTIPSTVAIMGKGVFLNCAKLTTATIESTATAIKTNMFAGCSTLKTVTIAQGPKTIESRAFYNCQELAEIKLPSGITSIGNEAFYQCIALTSVELADTVKTIGTYAFFGCEALKSLNLGKKLQKIGGNAFDSCIALEKVEIPSTVTEISSEAFSGCSLLKEVILPEGLTTIGEKAFNLCPLLAEITVNGRVTAIGDKAFGYGKRGAKIEGFTVNGYENTAAKTYAADNGFKFVSLGDYYFGDCGENAKWEFDPATGTLKIKGTGEMANYSSISNPAPYKRFSSEIKEIVFEDGITAIGNNAFYNIGPNNVYVPSTITKIGTKAFGKYSSGVLKDGFKISGYIGTAAEKYAADMGIEFEDLTPYSGSCGENASWKFDKESKTLTISGTGAMADYTLNTLKEYRKYKFDIKKIVVEEGITYIGNYAFIFNHSVEEIRFPKSVEKIGKNAFGYISYVKDGENKIKRDAEIKVYGYDATPVNSYLEDLNYVSLDPRPIPEFELDESITAKIDRENKIIYLGHQEMASADFMKKFPTNLFTSATVSTDVIGTGSTLELALGETTKESYTFVVPGDINGDSIVNSMDSLEILNHSVEIQLLTGNALIAGDISGDGVINSNDALLVLNISVGKDSIGFFIK